MLSILHYLEELLPSSAKHLKENYEKIKSHLKEIEERVPPTVDDCVNLSEVERLGMAKLDLNAISYFISGANNEITLKRNRKIYNKILLKQRILKDVSKINLNTEILGKKIALPICFSPTALQKMAHEDGEMATARSAYKNNTIVSISSFSSTSLEDVARENKTGIRFFQLYAIRQKSDRVAALLKEVEKNGFSALILTVDAPIMGFRDRDFKLKFHKPENVHFEIQRKILSIKQDSENQKHKEEEEKIIHRKLENEGNTKDTFTDDSNKEEIKNKSNEEIKAFDIKHDPKINNENNIFADTKKRIIAESIPEVSSIKKADAEKHISHTLDTDANKQTKPVVTEKRSDMFEVLKRNVDSGLDWSIINWLRSVITIPIIVKGILNTEDALIAAENEVDAIIVSNHGGRQLDTSPSTIEVLGSIVEKLNEYYEKNPNKKRMEVYIDGGIRRGTDVLKALALGAKAVFIGRPVIWGLAAGGENGVDKVLEILKDELVVAMKLTGCPNLKEINRNCLHQSGHKPKF